jgi:serine/threonine protein kinase
MAPEVLLGKSVSDPAIDWWSFGVLMYEFIVGLPPFNDQTPEKIFANILSGNVVYPEIGRGENMMTPEAYDLVSRLLTRDPEMRATAAEIKLHEFFRSERIFYSHH